MVYTVVINFTAELLPPGLQSFARVLMDSRASRPPATRRNNSAVLREKEDDGKQCGGLPRDSEFPQLVARPRSRDRPSRPPRGRILHFAFHAGNNDADAPCTLTRAIRHPLERSTPCARCLGQSSRIKLPILIGRGRDTVRRRRCAAPSSCIRDKCPLLLGSSRVP